MWSTKGATTRAAKATTEMLLYVLSKVDLHAASHEFPGLEEAIRGGNIL